MNMLVVVDQGEQNNVPENKWRSKEDASLKVIDSWGDSLQECTKVGPIWYLGLYIYEVDENLSEAAHEHFQEKLAYVVSDYQHIYKSSMFNTESLKSYITSRGFKIHDFVGSYKRDYGTYGLYLSL